MLLLPAAGCGSEGSKQAAPLKTGTGTKAEPESKPADAEAPATENKSVGPNGDQASKDETGGAEIPLSEIWALHTPGTKNILELDPGGDEKSLLKLPKDEIERRWKESPTRQIAEALLADTPGSDWPKEGEKAKQGFAVCGTGVDALKEAYEVLVKHKGVSNSFPKDTPVTLVFFYYETGSFVDILAVERREHSVDVRYRLVGPSDKMLAVGFALIPLGPLSTNGYDVTLIQQPAAHELLDHTRVPMSRNSGEKKRDKEFAERFVCKSFKFSVIARSSD